MRRRTYLVAGVGAVTGALAGCLGGDSGGDGGSSGTSSGETTDSGTSGGPTTAETNTGTSSGGDATVTVRSSERYGDYLTDAEGMSLYQFTNDEGGESTCYDGCAATWPPLTVEDEPSGGDGVSAELGTTERRDGSLQVTAGGAPLYYYTPDESPGDTKGQGVGGVWFLVAPDGSAIDGPVSATGTDDSTPTGTDEGTSTGTSASGGGTDDEGTEIETETTAGSAEGSDDGGPKY